MEFLPWLGPSERAAAIRSAIVEAMCPVNSGVRERLVLSAKML